MIEYALDLMIDNDRVEKYFIMLDEDDVLPLPAYKMEEALAEWLSCKTCEIMCFLPTSEIKTRFD